MTLPETEFARLAATLLLSAVAGAIALRLRQPLILAFICVGVGVGPLGLGWVAPHGQIELLSSMGVSVLLFLVGLRLDPGVIRTLGAVSLLTGLGQVVFTAFFGALICFALGMNTARSLYVAVALTFSSTIIIVKLLSDKREIDSLHGRIAVGFLVVQDIVVILAMIVLSSFGAPTDPAVAGAGGGAGAVLGALARAAVALVIMAVLARFVLPAATHLIARSTELLTLFAIAWAVSLSAAGEALGLSREIGAFLAGVSLAATPYREAIGGRLTSLRDFLLLFFFVSLGSALELGEIGAQIGPAILLSLFVLIGNPLIVMAIMGAMGYRRRTGFLAGLTVAQISEFSLILGALGVSLGHIDRQTLGLITVVGLITIGASTYLILYSGPIYERLAPWLSFFERRNPVAERGDPPPPSEPPFAIVMGLGRFGSAISARLAERGRAVLGADFDPRIVRLRQRAGLPTVYGDAEDPALADSLPHRGAAWVVCASPGRRINTAVLRHFRDAGFAGRIALTAHTAPEAHALRNAGADLVLIPFADAADRAAELLDEADAATDRAPAETPRT